MFRDEFVIANGLRLHCVTAGKSQLMLCQTSEQEFRKASSGVSRIAEYS